MGIFPWRPFEQEPALHLATNLHCHTEGTSLEILTHPATYLGQTPMWGVKGWVLNLQIRQPSNDLLSPASKQL